MTDEAKHTPGPWRAGDYESDEQGVAVYNGKVGIEEFMLAWVTNWCSSISDSEVEANARRIVAAVNACEGVPIEALEGGLVQELRDDLLSILQMLNTAEGLGEWEAMDSHFKQRIAERAKMDAARDKALATLAKAKEAQS